MTMRVRKAAYGFIRQESIPLSAAGGRVVQPGLNWAEEINQSTVCIKLINLIRCFEALAARTSDLRQMVIGKT